jgi:hypothetical protein
MMGFSVAVIATSTFAADERAAANVVKKYSEAIACQIQDVKYQRNQYKSVKVLQGDKELGGLGDIYVVYWEGDVGCNAGNASVTPNFTVVEQNGFSSVSPVVVTDYKFPLLDMVLLTDFSVKNEKLLINGLTYGPNDQQHNPSKKVSYTLKLDQINRAFVK